VRFERFFAFDPGGIMSGAVLSCKGRRFPTGGSLSAALRRVLRWRVSTTVVSGWLKHFAGNWVEFSIRFIPVAHF